MLHEVTISSAALRPTYVEIDLSAIEHNYRLLKAHVNQKKILLVLKANAYGHGLIRIADKLQTLGADYFGVAYLEEGIMLREAGIKTPILVMGGIVGDQIPLFLKWDLTITASSVEKLEQIEQAARRHQSRAKAHLKIDTGMERIGMHYYSAERLIRAAQGCQHTHIEGIFTHFARADESDESYTQLQVKRFEEVLALLSPAQRKQIIVHASNSGGLLQRSAPQYDMSRVGILLYGVHPSTEMKRDWDLRPALTWKSKVVFFKVVQADHPISYGGTWTTDLQTRVVTLPVGYGDGYMRAMSNQAYVLIRGHHYQQVGNICMDQCMINIGPNGTAYNGDEVILIGQQGDQSISAEDLADWAGTIPYEILTNINTRVPRVYVGQ